MIELFLNGLQFKDKNLSWGKACTCSGIQTTDRLVKCLYGKSVFARKFSLVKNVRGSVCMYGDGVYL